MKVAHVTYIHTHTGIGDGDRGWYMSFLPGDFSALATFLLLALFLEDANALDT